MTEILEYLNSKNISYTVSNGANGPEAIVKVCPVCKDKKGHLYVNTRTGVYHCKKCNAAGSFLTLKEIYKDLIPAKPLFPQEFEKKEIDPNELMTKVEIAHQTFLQTRKALRYARTRCFSDEAVDFFKLGYSKEEDGEWLWYTCFRNGLPVMIKKRSWPPKKTFKREVGGESELFNVDALTGINDYIIVCEGEADAIALWSHGFKQVVATTLGAKGIDNSWIDKLDKFQRIYFAYDQDIDGQEGAYRFASRLGLERCYKIRLPSNVKDINEYFMKGGTRESFEAIFNEASLFDVQYVTPLHEEIRKAFIKKQNIKNDEDEPRLHFPWPKLDYLTDGIMAGDLVVIAGKPSVGKTSFALNLIYTLARQKIPVLLFELEMRPERIVPRILGLHTKIDSMRVMENSEAVQLAYNELKDLPFYFAYIYKKPSFETCADTIRHCIKHYGIRALAFDNLHFLCRSVTEQVREVSVTVQSFKLLAEELAIPIFLIARPRKTTKDKMIDNEDLKDSADIEADSDIVILLHRNQKRIEGMSSQEGNFESKMLVRVSKARYSTGGTTVFEVKDSTCELEEK